MAIKRIRNSTYDPTLFALAETDLRRSDLTVPELIELGGNLCTAEELLALGHSNDIGMGRSGMLFAYYDPWTENYIPPSEFHRVRYLGEGLGGFASQLKLQRYSQPAGTLNSVYIPRLVNNEEFNWKSYLERNDLLIITEGEKKAACACKHSLPAIGLGGVDMFQSSKRGARELPILAKINWRNRPVGVVFDSDTDEGLKPEVAAAARRLMDWLLSKGAIPKLIVLPASEGKKVALDDYLVEFGPEQFMNDIVPNAIPHSDAALLMDAGSKYHYIQDLDRFVYKEDCRLIMNNAHLTRKLGMKQVSMPRLERFKSDAGFIMRMAPKAVDIADGLLMWGGSEQYYSMVYRPGEGRTVADEWGNLNLNLWEGWRCEYAGRSGALPGPGIRDKVMKEWNWVLDNVFGDDPVARAFVEDWLYYPIAVPGAKLNTFALVSSPQEGIGKSFISHMLAKYVYGLVKPGVRHAWQLSEGDLHSQFNPYMFATSFLEADDIASSDKEGTYKRIQSYVTSDTVQVNMKNVPQIVVENHTNIWITTNDSKPFFFGKNDRRAFIHVPKQAKKDRERFFKFKTMFDDGTAGATLLWYAREKYDAAAFDPTIEAPNTRGKADLVINSRSGIREWVDDLLVAAAEGGLTRVIATANELHALMEREMPYLANKMNPDSIGAALRESGMQRYGNGMQLTVREGQHETRRRAWMLADNREINLAPKADVEVLINNTPFDRQRAKVTKIESAAAARMRKLK